MSVQLIQRAIENPTPTTLTPQVMIQMNRLYGNQVIAKLVEQTQCGCDAAVPETGGMVANAVIQRGRGHKRGKKNPDDSDEESSDEENQDKKRSKSGEDEGPVEEVVGLKLNPTDSKFADLKGDHTSLSHNVKLGWAVKARLSNRQNPLWVPGHLIGLKKIGKSVPKKGVYYQAKIRIADQVIKNLFGITVADNIPITDIVSSPQIRELLGKTEKLAGKSSLGISDKEVQKVVQGEYSSITPFLMRNIIAMGPIVLQGGFIASKAFAEFASKRGVTLEVPMTSSGIDQRQALKASNTYAILATQLNRYDPKQKKGVIGEWILYGRDKSGQGKIPKLTEPALKKQEDKALTGVHPDYIFQQGSISSEPDIRLPVGDRRQQMHAEAKAVRSDTWQQILTDTVNEFLPYLPKKNESVKKDPPLQKTIAIALNRSSCGAKGKGTGKDGKSGYSGGCAAELADTINNFWTDLSKKLDANWVAFLRQQGFIRVEVSVGGQYSSEGELAPIFKAGGLVRLHPEYDFAADRPVPITGDRKKYLDTLKSLEENALSGKWVITQKLLQDILSSLQIPQNNLPKPLASAIVSQAGQEGLTGATHGEHRGRIACTSIAAAVLSYILRQVGTRQDVTNEGILNTVRQGIDIDYAARQALGGDAGSGESVKSVPKSIPNKIKQVVSTLKKATIETKKQSQSKKRADPKSSPDEKPQNRYFRPDEIITGTTAQDLNLVLNQDLIDNPTQAPNFDAANLSEEEATAQATHFFGVRGDYRRVTLALQRVGAGHGFLVTIGAATIMVANIGQDERGNDRYLFFDSHGVVRYEIYRTEADLASALEVHYPAFPGFDNEQFNSWAAVPYRLGGG